MIEPIKKIPTGHSTTNPSGVRELKNLDIFPIVVVGMGTVGQVVYKYLESLLSKMQLDIEKYLKSLDVKNSDYTVKLSKCVNAETYFICVPTPYDDQINKIDLKRIRDVLNWIQKESKAKLPKVVIKSTIVPGTTDMLQAEYPSMAIMHAPEFLSDLTAKDEYLQPDKVIIGYTDKSYIYAGDILNLMPRDIFSPVYDGPIKTLGDIVPAKVAETIKYSINCFYSLKVSYVNQLFDYCKKHSIDYQMVRRFGLGQDKRINDNHLDIYHKGYRGFGGKCLSKDLDAFTAASDPDELALLKRVKVYNKSLKSYDKTE